MIFLVVLVRQKYPIVKLEGYQNSQCVLKIVLKILIRVKFNFDLVLRFLYFVRFWLWFGKKRIVFNQFVFGWNCERNGWFGFLWPIYCFKVVNKFRLRTCNVILFRYNPRAIFNLVNKRNICEYLPNLVNILQKFVMFFGLLLFFANR